MRCELISPPVFQWKSDDIQISKGFDLVCGTSLRRLLECVGVVPCFDDQNQFNWQNLAVYVSENSFGGGPGHICYT